MRVTVKILQNGQEIGRKVLGVGSYRAGRSEFCDIVLEGDQISRSHIELRVTEASVYLTNMSAAGRVKLNHERVETGEVKEGDEIQIGNYSLVITFNESEYSEPVPEAVPEENVGAAEVPFESEPMPEPEDAEANVIPMQIPVQQQQQESNEYGFEGSLAVQRSETVIEAKPLVAKILFTAGAKAGQEMPLEAYEVTFGRSKKVDVFIDDEKLSRKHCKIARVGMGYRLIDLESRNGTFVNGMRVLEHPLSSFDEIEIGNTKMKFLILDLVAGDMGRGGALSPVGKEQTASIQVASAEAASGLARPTAARGSEVKRETQKGSRNRIYLLAIILLVGLYFLLPQDKPIEKPSEPQLKAVEKVTPGTQKATPQIPAEYFDLAAEVQRSIEGHYNSAVRAGQDEQYEQGIANLKAIHENIPFYKNSRELLDGFNRKLKEKQVAEAQLKARQNEKADLQLYLEEGVEYLKEGDFERAAEAFNAAILMDPKNETAMKGLRAAELKIHDLSQVPPEQDPEQEKKQKATALFQQAFTAFTNKEYQKAIDAAEAIRKIEIKGNTQYLNEAKQIIDRAKMLQKEEFEPFLIQAKERFAEGDYTASRDLCEEMLKRDAAYDDAKECVLKAKKQLNRLAKEAYTHGYILESMNRIEEAKQYWNRAKNYVRPGDDYYEKVIKKLEYYQ